jgi:hypothetical protein
MSRGGQGLRADVAVFEEELGEGVERRVVIEWVNHNGRVPVARTVPGEPFDITRRDRLGPS